MWYSRLRANALALAAAVTTLLLNPTFSQAQDNHPFNCGSDEYWQEKAKNNPEMIKQRSEMLQKMIANRGAGQKSARSGKIIIPVVFHILHTYGPENISRQRVLDMIKTLNDQYAGINSDLSSVRTMYTTTIGVPDVEFRLATKDPNGNCTDGVTRTYSTLTENARDNVKSIDYWDANKYLNIWVVSSINNFGNAGTVLGFAQFPWDNNKYTDGIVVRADQVLSGNATLAHEIGHYLGLLHTFESYAGSGCGNSCTSSGDFICDTPPSTGPSWGCPSSTYNTCTLDNPDQPDMWENFMDYSSCQHMFTLGQVDQMRSTFQTVQRRMSLVSATNLVSTGTDDGAIATNCTPKADFYTTTHVVCEGGSITFRDNSYNGTPTSYLWTFENSTPSIATVKDPVIKFNKAGIYKVKLKVSNTSGSNEIIKDAYVTVLPAVSDTKTPVAQNFETFDNRGWEFSGYNNVGWVVSDKASTSGANSLWLDNSNGSTEQSYIVTLPMVDMTTATDLKMKFKIAYAQKASTSTDELRVQVSSNCGQNFNTVYYKFGTGLATTNGKYYPIDFIPTTAEWRDVEISLSSYKDYKNLMVRFNVKNRSGNDVYIDDISIGGTTSGVKEFANQNDGVSIYPNPANDKINLSVNGVAAGNGTVEIYDMAGKKLQSIPSLRLGDGAGSVQLDKNAMNISAAGVYMVKIALGSEAYVRKLVITE
jgi:PKD repeat protein